MADKRAKMKVFSTTHLLADARPVAYVENDKKNTDWTHAAIYVLEKKSKSLLSQHESLIEMDS